MMMYTVLIIFAASLGIISSHPRGDHNICDTASGIIADVNQGAHLPDGISEIDILSDNHHVHFEPQRAASDINKWKESTIPYSLDPYLAHEAVSGIHEVMAEIEEHSCVRFVYSDEAVNRLHFVHGEGCYAQIGRQPHGETIISIGDGCESKVVVIHEILHGLGFRHENSREDRDSYISINYENIEQCYWHYFETDVFNFQRQSYDYDSVMHYDSYTLSKNGRRTVEALSNRYMFLGNCEGMSYLDTLKLNFLFSCTGKEISSSPVRPTPLFVSTDIIVTPIASSTNLRPTPVNSSTNIRGTPTLGSSADVRVTPIASSTNVHPTPIASRTDVRRTPVNSSTNIRATPMASSTDLRATPITSSTDVRATPVNSSTNIRATPIGSSTDLRATPLGSSTDVRATPITSSSDVRATPVNSSTNIRVTPIGSSTDLRATPLGSSTDVRATPLGSSTDVRATPIASSADVHPTTVNSSTNIHPTPIGSSADVRPTPVNSNTSVRATPGGSSIDQRAKPVGSSTDVRPTPVSSSADIRATAVSSNAEARVTPIASSTNVRPTSISLSAEIRATPLSSSTNVHATQLGSSAEVRPTSISLSKEVRATASVKTSPLPSKVIGTPIPETFLRAEDAVPCAFDKGFCGWMQEQSDKVGWRLQQVRPRPRLYDHTGRNGFFIHSTPIQTRSSYRYPIIFSKIGFFDGNVYCLQLFYSIVGTHWKRELSEQRPALSVFVETKYGESYLISKFLENGNPGWRQALIDVTAVPHKEARIVILAEFSGQKRASIAIDDIVIYKGQCPTQRQDEM